MSVCFLICNNTGTCFKAAKSYDRASDAFKKAADAHYNSHSYPFNYHQGVVQF